MNKYKIISIVGILACVCVAVVLFLSNAPGAEATQNNSNSQQATTISNKLKLRDNTYIPVMTDICNNCTDYEDREIDYEGFVYSQDDSNFVVRNYYCCGTDSYYVGLEIMYDGEFPANNEWVKVEGKIKIFEDETGKYPCVEAEKVTVMETRGQDTVY